MFDAWSQYTTSRKLTFIELFALRKAHKKIMSPAMKFVRALLLLAFVVPSTVLAADPFSGSYQLTVNGSVLGKLNPSTGHRLLLSYAPSFGGSFDNRLEYYTDGSYNVDPSGELIHNINEPKLEEQLMYSVPPWHGLGFTAGGLYHQNFRFVDHYFWAIVGPTFSLPLTKKATATFAIVAEKKCWAERLFYDFSGEFDYQLVEKWSAFAQLHRYENLGQFDPAPTQKREYEFGLSYALTEKQLLTASFFRHIQFGAPNDQFSFVKLKWQISF